MAINFFPCSTTPFPFLRRIFERIQFLENQIIFYAASAGWRTDPVAGWAIALRKWVFANLFGSNATGSREKQTSGTGRGDKPWWKPSTGNPVRGYLPPIQALIRLKELIKTMILAIYAFRFGHVAQLPPKVLALPLEINWSSKHSLTSFPPVPRATAQVSLPFAPPLTALIAESRSFYPSSTD